MEYSFKGQFDLPVRSIQAILESAIIEIGRLQAELDDANEKIKKLDQEKNAPKVQTPKKPAKHPGR